jgi:hypothetical protein
MVIKFTTLPRTIIMSIFWTILLALLLSSTRLETFFLNTVLSDSTNSTSISLRESESVHINILVDGLLETRTPTTLFLFVEQSERVCVYECVCVSDVVKRPFTEYICLSPYTTHSSPTQYHSITRIHLNVLNYYGYEYLSDMKMLSFTSATILDWQSVSNTQLICLSEQMRASSSTSHKQHQFEKFRAPGPVFLPF